MQRAGARLRLRWPLRERDPKRTRISLWPCSHSARPPTARESRPSLNGITTRSPSGRLRFCCRGGTSDLVRATNSMCHRSPVRNSSALCNAPETAAEHQCAGSWTGTRRMISRPHRVEGRVFVWSQNCMAAASTNASKTRAIPICEAIGFQPRGIEFQILPDLAPDMTPPRRASRLDNVYTVYRQFGGIAGGGFLHSRTP